MFIKMHFLFIFLTFMLLLSATESKASVTELKEPIGLIQFNDLTHSGEDTIFEFKIASNSDKCLLKPYQDSPDNCDIQFEKSQIGYEIYAINIYQQKAGTYQTYDPSDNQYYWISPVSKDFQYHDYVTLALQDGALSFSRSWDHKLYAEVGNKETAQDFSRFTAQPVKFIVPNKFDQNHQMPLIDVYLSKELKQPVYYFAYSNIHNSVFHLTDPNNTSAFPEVIPVFDETETLYQIGLSDFRFSSEGFDQSKYDQILKYHTAGFPIAWIKKENTQPVLFEASSSSIMKHLEKEYSGITTTHDTTVFYEGEHKIINGEQWINVSFSFTESCIYSFGQKHTFKGWIPVKNNAGKLNIKGFAMPRGC